MSTVTDPMSADPLTALNSEYDAEWKAHGNWSGSAWGSRAPASLVDYHAQISAIAASVPAAAYRDAIGSFLQAAADAAAVPPPNCAAHPSRIRSAAARTCGFLFLPQASSVPRSA